MSQRKASIATQPPKDKIEEIQEHIDILYDLISALENKMLILENKLSVVLTPSETKTPERILETPPPPTPLKRNSYFSDDSLPSNDDCILDFYDAQKFELERYV